MNMVVTSTKRNIDKVSVLSFILSFLIVWVHNGPAMYNASSYGSSGYILKIFDTKLHQILAFVVPFYFMVSGFLFFFNCDKENLTRKIFNRIYSLGIPFVLWNIVSYITVLAAEGAGVLTPREIDRGLLDAIINSSCSDLWFLRYLMVLVLISPILFFLMRSQIGAWGLFGGAVLIKFIFGSSIPVFPSFYLPIYLFGGIMAMHYTEYFLKPSIRTKIIAFILSITIAAFGVYVDFESSMFSMSLYGLIMPPCVWFGIDFLVDKIRLRYKVLPWMSTNFFVYINHFNIMKIAIALLSTASLSFIWVLGWYIVLPEIVLFILVIIGTFWKKWMPKSWKFVNGGRG